VVAAGVAFAASWYRRNQRADLGTLSHQWMAEQRLGAGHRSQQP
jgi:hypothetical protein